MHLSRSSTLQGPKLSHCPLFSALSLVPRPYEFTKTLPLPSVTPSPSITAAIVGYLPALCPPVLFASYSHAFNILNLYTFGNLGSQADILISVSLPKLVHHSACCDTSSRLGNQAHRGDFNKQLCTAKERKRLLSYTSSLTLKAWPQTFWWNSRLS